MVKLLVMVVLFSIAGGLPSPAMAGVYRCTMEDGRIEYRDHPCGGMAEEEAFLPYSYQKTDKKIVAQKTKAFKKTEKKLAAAEKRDKKENTRQAKLAKKQQLKAERDQIRCQSNKDKMILLEKKFKFGCKLRQCNALRQQIKHCEKMQQKYCRAP